MKTLNAFRLAAASVLALGVVNAHAAGTASDTMNLQATVVANCTISSADIDFGDYDLVVANASAAADANGDVTTACTLGSAPTLSISTGNNFNAGTRRLRQGTSSDYLNYSLYSDNYTTLWVDGVAVTTPTGAAVTNNIRARLPGGQNKPVGIYNDAVTITVTF